MSDTGGSTCLISGLPELCNATVHRRVLPPYARVRPFRFKRTCLPQQHAVSSSRKFLAAILKPKGHYRHGEPPLSAVIKLIKKRNAPCGAHRFMDGGSIFRLGGSVAHWATCSVSRVQKHLKLAYLLTELSAS